MKRVFLTCLIFGLMFPPSVSAFGMWIYNDYTISGPGGKYGLYEGLYCVVITSTSKPVSWSRVCLGPVHFTLPLRASQVLVGASASVFALGAAALLYFKLSGNHDHRT